MRRGIGMLSVLYFRLSLFDNQIRMNEFAPLNEAHRDIKLARTYSFHLKRNEN